MPYTRSEWEKHVEIAFNVAVDRLRENGALGMHCFLYTDKAQYIMPGSQDRDQFYLIVRSASVAVDAHAALVIMETWMRRVQKRDDESQAEFHERADAVQPRDAEDRQEAIMVAMSYRENGRISTFGRMAPIERDASGNFTGRGDIIEMPGMGGDAANVILPVSPAAAQQVIAREILESVGISMIPLGVETRH